MASDVPPEGSEPGLDPALSELTQLTEEQRRKRATQLSDEIARKYDPDRLSKMVVDGAGSGEPLDLATRMEMERRIGGSFGEVRVFRGAFAEAVTKRHKADAVTIANTGMILVREGPRANPKTALGKALLAHELTHVKQAQSGLHFALEEGAGGSGSHEKEAEHVESSVYAQEKGGKGGAPGHNRHQVNDMVVRRCFELLEERDHNHQSRNGAG